MKRISLVCVFLMYASVAYTYEMKDIYQHLDFTSFSNSLNPAVANNEKYFDDFAGEQKLPDPVIAKDSIVIEDEQWLYKIKVMYRKGNDYHVCFWDQAKQASYDSVQSIVIRKYGKDFVALSRNAIFSESDCREDVSD